METVIFSTDVAPWDESEWPKAYATSPFMSTTAWVIFRGLSWALFVGHYIAHVNYYWAEEGVMYFIYLSRWMATLEVIEETLYFITTLQASSLVNTVDKNRKMPTLAKVHMAMLSMILPSCLLSSGLYWALSPYLPPPYVSAAMHGGDVLAINLSFFLGRFPFDWNKIGWVTLLGVSYSIWTLIHYLLKIGTDDSAPCVEYPLNECPIYAQLDWHFPVQTGSLLAFGAVVGPPVLGGLYHFLTGTRDNCDSEAKSMREKFLEPEETPLVKEEPVKGLMCC